MTITREELDALPETGGIDARLLEIESKLEVSFPAD